MTDGPWDKAFLNVIEHACMRAIERSFSGIRDEAIKQALAQGFSAGVDWCFSEQFDVDVAKTALALGVSTDEAATGALRMGADGWELVCVTEAVNGLRTFYFKRPKQ